jgi:hypothetical protein
VIEAIFEASWLIGPTTAIVLPILHYCLYISRDWRERKYYVDRLRVYSVEQLQQGREKAMRQIRRYQASCARARPWERWTAKALRRIRHRRAERSLVLVTAIDEEIARQTGQQPPLSYLKARRRVLKK